MKKKVFFVILTTALVICVVFILFGLYAGGLFPFAPGYREVDRYLKINIDELSYVVNTLSNLDYHVVEIRKIPLREEDKHNMYVSYGSDRETIPIPDESLDYINALYDSGVDVISCEYSYANFSIWSSLSESRGLIYSRGGNMPNNEQYIEVRLLSRENWYYYVHNFEKARTRNPHLFQ